MGNENLHFERSLHGESWGNAHGGYFSDEEVARPYLEAIRSKAEEGGSSTLVDLGGGTGFVLSALCRTLGPGRRYVNVDTSEPQLREACQCGLVGMCASALEIARADIAPEGGMLVMHRSLMHYFGAEGQRPFLRHMRSLLEPGEYMVQQTACFERLEVRDCFNHMYDRMGTGKWYPGVEELRGMLGSAGFEVLEVRDAPPLDLRWRDLAARYRLDRKCGEDCCRELKRYGLDRDGTAVVDEEGFRSTLPYKIFISRA
jgi:SAM-dependent methyltransferase